MKKVKKVKKAVVKRQKKLTLEERVVKFHHNLKKINQSMEEYVALLSQSQSALVRKKAVEDYGTDETATLQRIADTNSKMAEVKKEEAIQAFVELVKLVKP